LGTARARFLVFRQDLELDNASADAGLLASLARAADGKSIPGEELPKLIHQLAADTAHLEVQEQTKKTLWDTWTLLLAVVSLLGLEWYLRKRWGLV
jgi:N6-adenosine-specific RNA methylase IME4